MNILINKDRHACLADFGLSTIVYVAPHDTVDISLSTGASRPSMNSKVSLMSFTPGGTVQWTSPELLNPEMFGLDNNRPTTQSDCYALGMVVYEVRRHLIVVRFLL